MGDVGREALEEIDGAVRGADLGWPCWEARVKNAIYENTSLCRRLYADPPGDLRWPLLAFRHPTANSITGGAFAPSTWASPYGGAYVFGDWERQWLRAVRLVPGGRRAAGAVQAIATNVPGPVAVHQGPGGTLYYLALNSGDLRRIMYRP